MNPRRPRFRKRLTRKEKAVVPCMMAAVVRSESRTIEEIEAEMEGRGRE